MQAASRSVSAPSALSPTHLVTLPNGLTLAAEQRAGPGFAFDLRVPLGSAHDPRGHEGSVSLLEEWLTKGAGTRDARQFQEALDDLGLRRGGGVGAEATRFAVSGLNADLGEALSLCADLVQRPLLPDAEFGVLLDLARQDLEAMQDSPAEELALVARRLAFPAALGGHSAGYAHPSSGTLESLQHIGAADVRALFGRFGAAGSILSVVSAHPCEDVEALVRQSFGNWRTATEAPERVSLIFAPDQTTHLPGDSQQAHLSLYWRGVDPTHPDWLPWHLSLGVLSGGSASRLFSAVREERGLAYSAQIGAQVLNDQGFMSGYAGSTPARAQETLDVMLQEVERLKQGVTDAEFLRARAALVASTVFGAESLRGRVVALTRDLSLFGAVRQPPELRAQIEALTLEDVNGFLERWEPGAPNLVTLGLRP
ncbi:insulinase family protein [Deinococcus sp. KNUC1210]|uniref:M16 family metallopeptidase n=1 Tax=Deinococcus sp. KNUC1210 TaxID=2917691 RepID=UPI001EF0958F|nr:pitrilysin family protein [Deinococcus sp. KNUC1210]ULH15141.1 insulinase family protein [Deinococcus sp. KNUC1210]